MKSMSIVLPIISTLNIFRLQTDPSNSERHFGCRAITTLSAVVLSTAAKRLPTAAQFIVYSQINRCAFVYIRRFVLFWILTTISLILSAISCRFTSIVLGTRIETSIHSGGLVWCVCTTRTYIVPVIAHLREPCTKSRWFQTATE